MIDNETHLTGENKKRFEKWYSNEGFDKLILSFEVLPPEMQKGVFEAYYGHSGIEIDTVFIPLSLVFDYEINGESQVRDAYQHTRPEAFKLALKQANKLMNEQLNN